MFLRKNLVFIESDENKKSNVGDFIEYLLECEKDMVKDDEKNEESSKLVGYFFSKILLDRNRNRLLLYGCFLKENYGENNEFIRIDIIFDDDEYYVILKIIDDFMKRLSEKCIFLWIIFLDFVG